MSREVSTKSLVILLFPGYENTADEWSKVVEYGHPDVGKPISFLRRLKKLKIPVQHVAVDWKQKTNVAEFNARLCEKFEKKTKFILIGHSLASLFCYNFVQQFKKRVKKVLLLDTTQIGPEGKSKVDKLLADGKDPIRVDYAAQTPVDDINWPVHTVLYRNLHVRDGTCTVKKDSGGDLLHVRYYVNAGHFVHIHDYVVDDVIADLS